MPEVPTFIELGFGELKAYNWYGVLAPAQTNSVIVTKLSEVIRQTMLLPEVQQRLLAQLLEPITTSPQAFKELLARDTQTWAKIINSAQIKPE